MPLHPCDKRLWLGHFTHSTTLFFYYISSLFLCSSRTPVFLLQPILPAPPSSSSFGSIDARSTGRPFPSLIPSLHYFQAQAHAASLLPFASTAKAGKKPNSAQLFCSTTLVPVFPPSHQQLSAWNKHEYTDKNKESLGPDPLCSILPPPRPRNLSLFPP